MIVATAAPQLLVVLADTRADDVGRAKIERRALDTPRRARQRDRAVIDGEIMLGRDLKAVTENIGAGARAIEVEESMVGQIHQGWKMARRFKRDRKLARAADPVDDARLKPAGKTALAVGARVGQNQRRLGLLGELIDPPEMSIEAVMAAMERIRAVVGFELDQCPVEHELRAGDAVGVSADGRPEEAARGEIA